MEDDPLDLRYLLTPLPANSVGEDRGVDVERLADEIAGLRTAAKRYGNAVDREDSSIGDAGLALENAAIRYVRKLDDEQYKASKPDYVAIMRAAERERARGDGN